MSSSYSPVFWLSLYLKPKNKLTEDKYHFESFKICLEIILKQKFQQAWPSNKVVTEESNFKKL